MLSYLFNVKLVFNSFLMDAQINKITIALVEDDQAILDAASMILENQGWEVLAFASGEQFLEDILGEKPDFLILDPHLSGIDGDEVIERLPMHLNKENMRIIVLTAHPNGEKTQSLLKLGVDDFLLKPVTEEILVNSIKKYLY